MRLNKVSYLCIVNLNILIMVQGKRAAMMYSLFGAFKVLWYDIVHIL